MVPGKIRRFLGQPTSDPTADPNLAFEAQADRILRPSSSQTARFAAGAPIVCLDNAPTGNCAVVAGEKVFKTLRINGSTISEEIDLRTAISSQASTHSDTLSAFKDQLNIKAVKWAHGVIDTTVITASANGRITLYDLNQIGSGAEVARIGEHARQVHKLAINPFRATWLLSASQDATARLFDLKSPVHSRAGLTFQSRAIFKCNADAVRDIQWSPKDGFYFACSTSSGTVQNWDTRKPGAPVLKIPAHESPCLSISWHPDGEHIVSGGFDQRCCVWDLSKNAEKRQRAKYTLVTPAPVSAVSWRPACWSTTAQAHRAAQVAVVYDDTNSMKIQNSTVHIWDVARPTLPFKEITEFETAPTGLLWHQRDLIWTVGREGEFVQTDVAFAPKVIDQRSLSNFSFSPSGEILMLLEERKGRTRPSITNPSEIQSRTRASGTQSQSPKQGQLSVSRSDSEEDVGGSFLGPGLRNKKQGRRHSTRSMSSISTTPPSINGAEGNILRLEEAVKVTGPYKPQQIMAVGSAPSATKRDVFQYLSSRYLRRMIRDVRESTNAGPVGPAINGRLAIIMEHFARSAEVVGHYRLAQTWRILSYTMELLLTRRAQYHREVRLARHEEKKAMHEKLENRERTENQRRMDQQVLKDSTPRKPLRSRSPLEGPVHLATKSILAEEMESTSNVATPLARPVKDSMILDSATTKVENDVFRLPPAAHSPSPLNTDKPRGTHPTTNSFSSEDGYDFYDMASLTTPAIDISAPQRKAPFRLDYNLRGSPGSRGPNSLLRHDSSESFQMFSSSGDSHRKFPSSSESGGHQSLFNAAQSASDAGSSWESSIPSARPGHQRSFESDESDMIGGDGPRLEPSSLSRSPPSLRIQKPLLPLDSDDGSADADEAERMSDSELIESWLPEDEGSLDILDTDYHFHRDDPSFMPDAIDPHLLVHRIIQFEIQTGSLNASAMVLLLKPHLRPGTIDDVQAPAILRQYQHRLTSMMLFTEAALLRKLCYPTYPTVFGQGLARNGLNLNYYCITCSKPLRKAELEVGRRLQRCERCQTYLDGCTVCRQVEEPLNTAQDYDVDAERYKGPAKTTNDAKLIDSNSPAARVWWWCQGCGHGGHMICMRMWHAGPAMNEGAYFSDGCCPMEGCLHPCLPGKWRDEVTAEKSVAKSEEMSRLIKENTKAVGKMTRAGSGGVKRDGREVGESKAVESVRGALIGMGPGAAAERERKKSVKVIAPGEE